ncbi:MAG: alcohol dehydrogenase catalytic domain-containing protein [Micromonosporaceae bacterium]|nr:alcohol dehydrogenase catalytic domain-containing protein [Micromonosporaceae bacterium]
MYAAKYVGRGAIAVVEVEASPPAAAEVQIAVAYTGICGTDLHVLHGAMDTRVSVPAILGHEMSGRIAGLGAGVTGWAVGDPVTVMPLCWCGSCPACQSGNSHICQQLNFVGIDSPGALQQRWNVPAALLVRLPKTLPLAPAALVEPTAVAVHDVRRAELVPGEAAVVVGAGPIGLLIACVARIEGARVLVTEIDWLRRETAARLGFDVLDPAAPGAVDQVDDWAAGAGAAVAFEVSSSQAGLDFALRSLAVRGRLVVVGIHPPRREIDLHRVFWRELTLAGARVYQRPDFERAVELVAGGGIPTETLISRIEPLDTAEAAFRCLESGQGVMKVLVKCGSDG